MNAERVVLRPGILIVNACDVVLHAMSPNNLLLLCVNLTHYFHLQIIIKKEEFPLRMHVPILYGSQHPGSAFQQLLLRFTERRLGCLACFFGGHHRKRMRNCAEMMGVCV